MNEPVIAPKNWAIGSSEWAGLSKLTEETGEVLQVIGKLMSNDGQASHWVGTDLRVRMMEELGDLLASADFVIHHNFNQAEITLIAERAARKRALFEKWQIEQSIPNSESSNHG